MTKTIHLKRAMRVAFLVLLLGVVGMGKGYAYDFSAVCETGQTLYYNIIDDANHLVELTYPGVYDPSQGIYDCWLGYNKPTGRIVFPTNVIYNSIVYTVSQIGDRAFYRCDRLAGSLTIPDNVTVIGAGAFYGCYLFSGELTLPNSLVSIGGSAFSECHGLTGSLNIPNTVTEIGWGAFWSTGFSSVEIPNSVTTIGNCAFAWCENLASIILPNTINRIGSGAFIDCKSLTSITIPNSVKYIGGDVGSSIPENNWGAFQDCVGLTTISIPGSVEHIGKNVFYGCLELVEINVDANNTHYTSREGVLFNYAMDTIMQVPSGKTGSCVVPNSVVSIGEAFRNSSLSSITIPSLVETIEMSALRGCTSLTTLNYNAVRCTSDLYIAPGNYYGATPQYWLKECTSLTTVNIGEAVESIPYRAFYGIESLTNVTIGKSVKTIGENAFANNPRLNMVYYNAEKDVNAPINVFSDCPNLTTIHIGADVKEIGSNIFKGCNTVHLVVALGPTPAVLDAGAFSDIVDNSMLMVSCGNRVTYFSVWNMFPFNNIIEDCNTYPVTSGVVGTGGTVTLSSASAQMGTTVTLTVTPNPGMHLTSLTVCNANDPTQVVPITLVGKASSTYRFTMPPFGVVVMATFATSTSVGEINNGIPSVVYPNPTTGNVKIEALDLRHVSIFNALGQLVYDSQADGDTFECDLSGHKAGIYLIRMETASGVTTNRVVLTK